MKVSLNIVKSLIDLELPSVSELVERINQRLGGVEETTDLGQKYKDAKIVKVVECEKHSNADKLSVCKIDVGNDELVQVVCGAPNVHAGMYAIWLPPESVVPSTYEDKEPFVLGARELRGVMSHGMLAAADELAIGSDHNGIVEITDFDLPEGAKLAAGDSFAVTFGLNDVIIDIENKMFTHRPDLFGQLGVAREINAILQDSADRNEFVDNRFENPSWYWMQPEFAGAEGLELEVFNDASEASPRFMAVAMKGASVTDSPLWLKCQLVAMGSKPINSIVDWTNYIMLMTAQPTHAYDYDKIRGHKIGVRMANKGEKINLLNGKTYELTEEDIVIADGEGAIGLAGVMGGFDSEVTSDTKNIVIEVANFNMYKVRKTSMRYGLFTDAVTRFNKGQSPLQTDRVVSRLLDLLPGIQASLVHDLHDKPTELAEVSVQGEVRYTASFVNDRLGTDFTSAQIGNVLRPTNIATYSPDDEPEVLVSTAPFWRTDVELPEDIVEEIGRLYGYDRLPKKLPVRSMKPTPKNATRQTKSLLRRSLSKSGANEVLTYSFVHENTFKKAEQDVTQAYKLGNALSPDLQYYRLSVLPSLLEKVNLNIKAGYDEFAIFEIGKAQNKIHHTDDNGLPKEMNFLDMVYASKVQKQGAAFYRIRKFADQLAQDIGCKFLYRKADQDMGYPVTAPFDLTRSAIVETKDGVFVGMIGELKSQVVRAFKLPAYTAAMTFDIENIERIVSGSVSSYKQLSRYPSISNDVSIKASSEVGYSDLLEAIETVISDKKAAMDTSVELLNIYQPEGSEDKTTTFRIKFVSHDTTLTDKDIAPIIKDIAKHVEAKFDATIA